MVTSANFHDKPSPHPLIGRDGGTLQAAAPNCLEPTANVAFPPSTRKKWGEGQAALLTPIMPCFAVLIEYTDGQSNVSYNYTEVQGAHFDAINAKAVACGNDCVDRNRRHTCALL
ncbi:hypothetical protein XELAEV_18035823mg [Xenopus laevis]|uniref:Uncharacterized protein n=1 Tax=Xenopus laevis TaxID=8355 RepID=A0A974HCH4_XENLA|nr:hypothetical protein XELAEV_18035823mg [Xenopus laevis]